mgnify:CR=1 FL=1
MNISIQFDAHRAITALDALADPALAPRAAKVAAETYHGDILDWIGGGHAFTTHTGALEQSIGWMPEGDGALVYAQNEVAPYLEFGTGTHGPKHQPYWIKPKEGRKALKFPAGPGVNVFRRGVLHPGIEATPYFFADQSARQEHMAEAVLADIARRL